MEILKSGHQYIKYDRFFYTFFAFRKQNKFSINNTIIRKDRKSQLIFFPRAWFHPSECRAPVWGWPEPGNHRDSGSDSGTLGSGLDQSISSVTQLTWAKRVPRQHSDASREEVLCDVSAKLVIRPLPAIWGLGSWENFAFGIFSGKV